MPICMSIYGIFLAMGRLQFDQGNSEENIYENAINMFTTVHRSKRRNSKYNILKVLFLFKFKSLNKQHCTQKEFRLNSPSRHPIEKYRAGRRFSFFCIVTWFERNQHPVS
jgi:hypothetical protein